MKKLIYLIVLLPLMTLSQSNSNDLMNMTEITVRPGHEAQFLEGVKLWKECYLENNGTSTWNLWKRVQGKGTVYILTGRMANWAEMDKPTEEASKACRSTVKDFIFPNVKSVDYNIARFNSNRSRLPMADMKVVNASFFKVNNSNDFNSVVNDVTSTLKSAEGESRGFWYSVIGGAANQPDYFVSVPYKNFAEMDKDRDNVWAIYEKAHGKKKTDATRAKFRASVNKIWSYLFTLNQDLSRQ